MEELTGEIRQFPEAAIKRAAPLFVDFDIGYRNSIRDRAHRLAPVIWSMTDPKGIITLTERRHWVRFCPTGQREARAC